MRLLLNRPAIFRNLLILFLLISCALRLYHIDFKDLWVDEAHPWWYATLPLQESLRLGYTGGPVNSGADPLYNLLLHVWIQLTGDSVFSLRLLSAFTNLTGVAYLYRVTSRAFGPGPGRIALCIATVSPLWIFFSQEVRPYAFTPTLMLMMIEAVILIADSGIYQWRPWGQLVVGEALSLYAHGFMLFAVIAINLWLGWLWLRQSERWRWLRNWLFSQLAALVLIAPSIPLYFARAGGIRNPFAPTHTFSEFANELWAYLMGIPWENVADPILLRLPVFLILMLVWAGLLGLAIRRERARLALDVLWLSGTIAVMSLLYTWRDPSFHPRYVAFLTAPLFLFMAALIASLLSHRRWEHIVGIALLTLLALSALISLKALYTGALSGYRHPSTRAVSEAIRATFGTQDALVVVAPHDFTLNYYGIGDVPLGWARFDEGIDLPADTLAFVSRAQNIGILRNNNEHSDSRHILPFYLERYGVLVERRHFEGYDLSIYTLDEDAQPGLVEFEPVSFNWGGLALTGSSIVSGDAVTVALRWEVQPGFDHDVRYAAAVRLTDPETAWLIASADGLLFDNRGNPSDAWAEVASTMQYVVLPLQPGTPPIDAELSVTLYDSVTGEALDLLDSSGAPAGQQANLGAIRLGPAPQTWAYDDQWPWQLAVLDSEEVAGYITDTATVAPSGTLGVTLGWRRTPDFLAENAVRLELVQGDAILAEDAGPPLQGRTPADVPDGQLWLDRRLLRVSRDAVPGLADLIVWIGNSRLILTQVEIASIAHITEHPAIGTPLEVSFGDRIRLLGYRLEAPEHLTSADTVMLTLYWQALTDGLPESNFKVFTQILGEDGHLVGQHDGVPVYESRPFSEWLAGEYLIDEHPMVFIAPYVGPIRIQIGLYDPVTLQRLLTDDGRDAVVLPVDLTVESGE